MRETQRATMNSFLLFYIEKNYILLEDKLIKNLVYIVRFVLQFFRMAVYWKYSNKTLTPR